MENKLDDKTKAEILDNITKYGSIFEDEAKENPIIARNPGPLINRAGGVPRFHTSAANKFKPIVEMPEPFASLTGFHPAEIRCCLCNRIIRYPCWYHVERYIKNHIHYFVCHSVHDGIKEDRVSTRCKRR